jgi:hypothetical protein
MALRDLDRLDLNILLPESDHTREQGDKKKKEGNDARRNLNTNGPPKCKKPPTDKGGGFYKISLEQQVPRVDQRRI